MDRLATLVRGLASAEDRLREILVARVLVRWDCVDRQPADLYESNTSALPMLAKRHLVHREAEASVVEKLLIQVHAAGQGWEPANVARALIDATDALLPFSLSRGAVGRQALREKVLSIVSLLLPHFSEDPGPTRKASGTRVRFTVNTSAAPRSLARATGLLDRRSAASLQRPRGGRVPEPTDSIARTRRVNEDSDPPRRRVTMSPASKRPAGDPEIRPVQRDDGRPLVHGLRGAVFEVGPFGVAPVCYRPLIEVEQPSRMRSGEILIVAAGSVTKVFDDREQQAGSMTVSYRGPGYRKFDRVGEAGLEALRIRVDSRFADYVENTYFDGSGIPRHYDAVDLQNVPARILEECASKSPSPLVVDGLLRQMIGWAARFEQEANSAPTPPDWLAQAVAILEKSFRRSVKIREVAAQLGVAPAQFSRVFRRFRGQSPQSFLVSLRIREAALLLASSELSVAKIAGALGYFDRPHFSREFARLLGQSPTAYRLASRLE
jgi:AraC-like DNA-binding protein